jgi:D-alanyl-D-alanine carboxypeptidase
MSNQIFYRRGAARLTLAPVCLLAALLSFALAAGVARAKPLSPPDRKFVDATVAEAMKTEHLPGLSIEISGPRGDYAKAYGVADRATGAPLRLNDHIRMASITKTFVATAILRQVASGGLGLEDPISTWFPTVPNAPRITVRDLLGMRSGLYEYTSDVKFLKDFTANPLMHFTPQDALEIISSNEPIAEPDTETHYADTNYVLLGLILEKVTGETAEEAVTKDVIKPLHLEHTSFPTTAKIPAPFAHGYYGGEDLKAVKPDDLEDYTYVNPKIAWTAGAMISTVGDLHKYARELGTGALLTPQLWAERQRFNPLPNEGIPVGYGLGLLHPGNWLGHDGAIFGFSSVAFYEPETKAAISAVANLSSNSTTPTLDLFGQLAAHLYPDSFKGGGSANAGAARRAIKPAPAPDPSSREAKIESAVEAVMKKEKIPGAIVGVWQKGQKPFEHAFGIRDKKTRAPMTTGLYMRIGSETKTFTGTAVLQLARERKVGLDDPISNYIAGVPNGQNITIRELGEMRSGLLSYTATEQWVLQFVSHPYLQWKPEELLPFSFSKPALFAPGGKFNYSNTNTVLLGLLVEKLSGESLHTYVTKHILKPLGMTHSLFPTGAEFPSPHAQGYTKQTLNGKETTATNWNPSWGWAAGAVISDLHDLRIWARSVATGTLVGKAAQIQRERFIPAEGLEPAEYGFALFDINGWIGHNGSLPGYQSVTVYSPRLKTTMVILLNSDETPASGNELSTSVGKAITKVISPKNIFYFNPGAQQKPAS